MSDTTPALLAAGEALAGARCPCGHVIPSHRGLGCAECLCARPWFDALLASGVVLDVAVDEDGLTAAEQRIAAALWEKWQDPNPAVPGVLIRADPRTVAQVAYRAALGTTP